MTLDQIEFMFKRSLNNMFRKSKLLLTFIVLALCGVFVVFFRALSLSSGFWIQMSLSFLPVFLCAGVMLSTGIVLIRVYYDEIKQREQSYREILNKSWEVIIGATYFAIPLILGYLLLWMFLGFFVLLEEIPGIGNLFGVILAFAPFILNIASILLCVLSLAMLFLVTPVVALKGLSRVRVTQFIMRRVRDDLFSNLILGFVAILPLLLTIAVLTFAAFLTGGFCSSCKTPMHVVLQWFFVMIPYTALLAPSVIFFFNFSAEAHAFYAKKMQEESRSCA